MTTDLWPHQRRALDLIERYPGTGLWLDMGTGKSRVVVEYVKSAGLRRVLVVAPKAALGVWRREFGLWARISPVVLDKGTSTTKAKRIRTLPPASHTVVVVVNYESAWRGELGRALEVESWDLIVADESHRIKAPRGRAALYLCKLARRCPKRVALSGTPLPHSPLDAFSQYKFLNPTIFGVHFVGFRARYAILQRRSIPGRQSFDEIVGWQNQGEFRERFDSISMKVSSDEVLDLPEEQDAWLPVALSPKGARMYAQLEANLIAEIEGSDEPVTAANVLAKLLRLQQLTGGHATAESGEVYSVDSAKRDALADWLEDIPEDEPVVVFCRFVAEIDAAREVFEAAGRTVGEISGRAKTLLDGDARWAPEHTAGVVQIQAGGVGIDLTAARYAVYWSTGWSLGDYLQSRKRLHRPGQTRRVLYTHLVATGTVDERVAQALRNRQALVDSFVEGVTARAS